MVGHEEHAVVLAGRVQRVQHRPHHARIQPADRFHLAVQIAQMAQIVGRFEMQQHKVVAALQRVQSGLHLALVVGVQRAGRAGYARRLESAQPRDAAHQRHGGHGGSGLAELLGKVVEHRRAPRAPEPHGVGGHAPLGDALFVDGMLGKNGVRGLLQRAQQLGLLALGLIAVDHASGDVVRRGQLERRVACVHHGDVAERVGHGDAHMRLLHQRGEFGIVRKIVGQTVRVLAVYAVSVVAGHHAALIGAVDRGQIHAEGDLVFTERDLLARRLERRAPAIAPDGIMSQQRQKGHVAARRKFGGAGAYAPQLAPGHARHIRARSVFERRFSAPRFDFFIGHAVADNQHILHRDDSSSHKLLRRRFSNLTTERPEIANSPAETRARRESRPPFRNTLLQKCGL